MVFPNWGALSANIMNSHNRKKHGSIGKPDTITRKPTLKDWTIAILFMTVPTVFIWLVFWWLMSR